MVPPGDHGILRSQLCADLMRGGKQTDYSFRGYRMVCVGFRSQASTGDDSGDLNSIFVSLSNLSLA